MLENLAKEIQILNILTSKYSTSSLLLFTKAPLPKAMNAYSLLLEVLQSYFIFILTVLSRSCCRSLNLKCQLCSLRHTEMAICLALAVSSSLSCVRTHAFTVSAGTGCAQVGRFGSGQIRQASMSANHFGPDEEIYQQPCDRYWMKLGETG